MTHLIDLGFIFMLSGMFAGCGYLFITIQERTILGKINVVDRPRWIPKAKFQQRLGHLAMFAGMGNLAAFILTNKNADLISLVTFFLALIFFTEGIRRFIRAQIEREKNRDRT